MNDFRKSIERRDRFFVSIADAIPQVVWRCRADGWREYSNARYTEAIGVPIERSYGWGWLDFVHPEDVAEARHTWMRALKTREPFGVELRMRHVPTGRYRWYLVRAMPLFDEDGRLEGWSGTSTDIDRSKGYQAELRMLTDIGRLLLGARSPRDGFDAVLGGVVPGQADWAFAVALDREGAITVAALETNGDARTVSLSPDLAPLARAPGLSASLTGAQPQAFLTIDDEWFGDATIAALSPFERLRGGTALTAPMLVGARTVGALALFRSADRAPLEPRDLPAFSELAQRLAMTLRNVEAFEHERRVAESFQRAALPVRLPSTDEVRFDAHYEAGRSEALVGGDWYDAVELMGGRVLVSIGDVSGSGLAAAVTMGLVRQSIRAAAQAVPDPAAILEAADRALRSDDPDRIVTAFVGVFDLCTSDFWFASAGHPPALLRHPDGTIVELRTPGPPLGLRRKRHVAVSESLRLLPDSLVVLYTDGLIEATRDILAGERRLRQLLADPAILNSASAADSLRRTMLAGGSHDDVAILTIRTRDASLTRSDALPTRAWRFEATDLEGAAGARREFTGLLRSLPITAAEVANAELVFGELVGNSMKHTSGEIEARLSWTGANPVLHVLDEGRGYGQLAAHPPDALSESGRGLFLIARLAEDFSVGRRPGGGSHSRAVLAPAKLPRR